VTGEIITVLFQFCFNYATSLKTYPPKKICVPYYSLDAVECSAAGSCKNAIHVRLLVMTIMNNSIALTSVTDEVSRAADVCY